MIDEHETRISISLSPLPRRRSGVQPYSGNSNTVCYAFAYKSNTTSKASVASSFSTQLSFQPYAIVAGHPLRHPLNPP